MNKYTLLRLRCNILIRKFILNSLLSVLRPSNKLVIIISQNLDKHIVAYHKRIHNIYASKFHLNLVN
ncbi:hypothetical protein B0P06_003786 [Clostridium saccharoperbutylacetonicum]|jgi:hypothetical protein|uniref:Spo0E like sporulation regulatory protein n=1 Tax=Clostridium saccharoperbutylacetonicum N1-4(HMT) TaxID=931276 RepID=M1MIZ6_9CLOT|nr:hypothetical protein Cspa_c41510 [Clostridium saccharoperbutylacetonicum N1-4(HMT)]NRT61323.1 hypothetical protein [Clostridium saccharoperbutylacetonicum]NSB24640.1 hypothetical protein [Clostridium saccharoperbutylacetonicum]NSB44015.1 hypothetical protein [Clostridium saccharoperbutylacetonicum]